MESTIWALESTIPLFLIMKSDRRQGDKREIHKPELVTLVPYILSVLKYLFSTLLFTIKK